MKLLFVILAHNWPEHVSALARTLCLAASDGRAIIHYDAGADPRDAATLAEFVSCLDRVQLATKRIKCRWGDYSLVEAVAASLGEAARTHDSFDYVVLLSGACLPNRPIKHLEHFLQLNAGREFIEVADSDWVLDGLRDERHRFYFPFPPAIRRNTLEVNWVRFQRALGVSREAPNGLEVKFGSQWWVLSWSMCKRILSYIEDNPKVISFFRKTYLPDEMVFPTIVNELASTGSIAGFNLTTYHFNCSGKPVVFHDDHRDLVPGLNKFFFRKASPEAAGLRAACLDIAMAQGGAVPSFAAVGCPDNELAERIARQVAYHAPGQIFRRDR